MAFGMPLDAQPAVAGQRDGRGVEVGWDGERIENSLQRLRVAALPAPAIVPQPEVVEGCGDAVAPDDADGARLSSGASEPSAARTISWK